jgi:hypothetical protein
MDVLMGAFYRAGGGNPRGWVGDMVVASGAPSKLQLLKVKATGWSIDEGETKRKRRLVNPLASRMAQALGAVADAEVDGGDTRDGGRREGDWAGNEPKS